MSDVAATEWKSGSNLPVLQTAAAIAISMAICKSAMWMSKLLGIQGGILPLITALVVILATLLPTHFAYIAPAGDAVAAVLMQVPFFLCLVPFVLVFFKRKLNIISLKLDCEMHTLNMQINKTYSHLQIFRKAD